MNTLMLRARSYFYQNMTLSLLKLVIVLWAIMIIFLVIWIQNKWILAGILAYEVLP